MGAKADGVALLGRPGLSGINRPRAEARPAAQPFAWRRLRLRTRLGVLFVLAFALLAAGFGAVILQISNAADARLAEVALDAQAQILRKVLERQGAGLVVSARRIAEAPGLVAAVRRRDVAAVAAAIDGIAGVKAIPDLLRLDIVDVQERVLHSYRPGAAAGPLQELAGLARVLERGQDTAGPSREADGSFVLRAAVPVAGDQAAAPGRAATAGAVIVEVRLTAALAETAASTGTAVLLLDQRGALMEATDPAVWAKLGGSASLSTGIRIVRAGGRALSVSVVPLLDSAGGRLGSEMQVRDVTDAEDERRFTTIVSFTGVLLILLLIPLVLYWIIDRAFRPLDTVVTALNALSAGNTEVEVSGESRPDEIGAIARAVRVFRERNRDLTRQRLRQERGRRRQERFIRQQMVQMGETLDVDGRLDMLADTESIEGALLQMERMEEAFPEGGEGGGQPATARMPGDDLGVLALGFRVMSLRVITQHSRMNQLVLELRDALKARTELIGLQQQFEIATKMQAEMLPQALPPRPDVQARGGLLPAREFGGDFYDFFPLGPTEIAVVAGNVAGGSLQSAFLALTARTLLKAVLVCGVGPAAAVGKVNGLLAAENQKGLGVAALVMLLDTRTSRLTCCGSGIPAPLMLRRLGDAVAMALPENPLIGRQPGLKFQEAAFDLPLRTTLVVHTPGLAEGDEDGLLAVLRSCNDPGADAVLNAVMSMASNDRGEASRDASCVVFRYAAAV